MTTRRSLPMSELKTQRERLYKMIRRATNTTAGANISAVLCNTRLGSEAWGRYRAIEKEAGDCRDPQALASLLNQASAALDEVAQIAEP